MNRRSFFTWITRGIGAAVALGLGLPLLLLGISPTLRRRPNSVWEPVGIVDDFTVGEVARAEVPIHRPDWSQEPATKSVYVWRPARDEVVVFARSCTDLGCPVNYDPGSQCFVCPCHGGVFAIDGTRMAGPPPRPLYRFNHRVREGIVEIDLYSVPPMV